MATLESIGLAIMKQRNSLGLSQEDLAAEAQIARNYVSRIENGHVSLSVEVFLRIATALSIDPAKLLK